MIIKDIFLLTSFILLPTIIRAFILLPSSSPTSIVILTQRSSSSSTKKGLLRQLALSNNENTVENDQDNDSDNDNNSDNDDDDTITCPREFQKRMRQQQLDAIIKKRSRSSTSSSSNVVKTKKESVLKRKQGEAASASMDLPKQPLVKTIQGGSNLIFAMARQMAEINNNIQQAPTTIAPTTSSTASTTTTTTSSTTPTSPRWHGESITAAATTTTTIRDVRKEPPLMNAQGYASSIWTNARKRNKPSLWRYAIKTFDRMQEQSKNNPMTLHITNIHYEGVLVAASKLGYSKRAIEIYNTVKAREQQIRNKQSKKNQQRYPPYIRITENMIFSIIRACVRDSINIYKQKINNNNNDDENNKSSPREPLDNAVTILQEIQNEYKHIPITAVHWNALAAAYQSINEIEYSNTLLLHNLKDRIGGPEIENIFIDKGSNLNIYDVQAKDKGSYSLLVSNAINKQQWGDAIDALRNMTDYGGVYPVSRHLNIWNEISERQTRHRYANSWKKKRDAALAESSIAKVLK